MVHDCDLLRTAVASNRLFRVQDKELRDIRDRMQDKEGELDTLRKAGKNLRERLDEKEVETRGIMDRVSRSRTLVYISGWIFGAQP